MVPHVAARATNALPLSSAGRIACCRRLQAYPRGSFPLITWSCILHGSIREGTSISTAATIDELDDVAIEHVVRRDALIAAGLFIEDPEEDQTLAFPVPHGVRIERLLTSYDTKTTTGRKVRCAGCPTHTKHYRGFRALLDNGQQANIGIDCGETHATPGAWEEMNASLSRRQRDAYNAARVQPTLQALERAEPLLKTWHDRSKVAVTFMRQIEDAFPALAAAFAQAGKQDEGRLEFVRNRELNKQERRLRNGQRWEGVTVYCATIPYPASFDRSFATSGIVSAFQGMKSARQILLDNPTPSQVSDALQRLRLARKLLDDSAAIHDGLLANLDPAWWQGACRWANVEKLTPGTLRLEGRTLICETDHADISLPLPDPALLPSGWDALRGLLPG
jgi:hypothetical protein